MLPRRQLCIKVAYVKWWRPGADAQVREVADAQVQTARIVSGWIRVWWCVPADLGPNPSDDSIVNAVLSDFGDQKFAIKTVEGIAEV